MKNFVLVTKGSYGDLVPLLVLGEALNRRGNKVVLITHCHYEREVRNMGLDFDTWDTPAEYQAFINDGYLLDSPSGIGTFADRHVFPKLQHEYTVILRHCKPANTVIVARYMASLAAPFLAERYQLPYVSVLTAVAQVECLDILAEFYRARLGDKINAARATLNLPAVADWRRWTGSPSHFLACWPDWFARSDEWPSRLSYLGFLRCDHAEQGTLPSELEKINKPVLITGGTAVWTHADRFYEIAMAACGLLGRNAVVVCRHEHLVPRTLLPGTQWYKQLPFASLIPQVSAVIHHGGTSVLVRALASLVPQVAMPYGGDRPDTASRLAALGVCVKVPFACWTAEAVARALDEALTSDAMRVACLQVQTKIDEATLLSEGCRRLETLREWSASQIGSICSVG